ncbi:MAG: ATP-binding cassette domain-containing protein [Weeksellaceae bacterium]
MITVKNLRKIYKTPIKTDNTLKDFFDRQYKEHTALHDISFEIEQNELIGFIGPNGAGKTTTMKIMTGILYPTAGEVQVLGYTPFDKKHEFLKQIAFVMGQKNQMLWELPATDTYKLNKEIYEIPDAKYKKTLGELTDLLEVGSFIDRPVKTLSLGQRMRVELIASLIHSPKVLFLDEPTIGLDIFAQTTIINFIKEYQKQYKSTVILTSHYMQDVQRLAKRVILIDHGGIIYDGALKELVEKHSSLKRIQVMLNSEIDVQKLKLPADTQIEYQYPQLRLTVKKDQIEEVIQKTLSHVDYDDITIENETLEEVIKKSFKQE